METGRTSFGLTLLVDKPLGWTSFDVVNKLRYAARSIIGQKKVKVGHAGTLDPLATGLMIVCVGLHTKSIESLIGLDKSYGGRFVLGATTPSYDLETEINHIYDLPTRNDQDLLILAGRFIGAQSQVPPAFSAKKIDGKRAYVSARKGDHVELKPLEIFIHSFAIDPSNYPEIQFELRCSKGTYVRSLVSDFGRAAGCGAYLKELQRTSIGDFHLVDALQVDVAIQAMSKAYDNYLQARSD